MRKYIFQFLHFYVLLFSVINNIWEKTIKYLIFLADHNSSSEYCTIKQYFFCNRGRCKLFEEGRKGTFQNTSLVEFGWTMWQPRVDGRHDGSLFSRRADLISMTNKARHKMLPWKYITYVAEYHSAGWRTIFNDVSWDVGLHLDRHHGPERSLEFGVGVWLFFRQRGFGNLPFCMYDGTFVSFLFAVGYNYDIKLKVPK